MFVLSGVCPFVLFLLAIVLSILRRCTDFDYPFGIFKLFLILGISFDLRLRSSYDALNRLTVTRLTRRVALVKQELLTIPGYLIDACDHLGF